MGARRVNLCICRIFACFINLCLESLSFRYDERFKEIFKQPLNECECIVEWAFVEIFITKCSRSMCVLLLRSVKSVTVTHSVLDLFRLYIHMGKCNVFFFFFLFYVELLFSL